MDVPKIIYREMEVIKAALIVVGLTIAGNTLLLGQAEMEPVPSQWLHDGKLVVEQLKFSIDSPSFDAKWTYKQSTAKGRKVTSFVAAEPSGSNFVLAVMDGTGNMDGGQFFDGIKGSVPKEWRMDDEKLEPSVFPLKGSSKFSMTLHLPNEMSVYGHGYVVQGSGRTYIMEVFSPDAAEPPEFTRFAGALTIIPPPKGAYHWLFYPFVIVVGFMFLGIPIWFSRKAKPIGDKPFRWGTYVGILMGLLAAYFSTVIVSAYDIYGKEVGIALCISALIASVGILRRRRYGVILYVVTNLLVLMASPFMSAMRNEPFTPTTPEQESQTAPSLVFLGFSIAYFVKRWRLMGKAVVHDVVIKPPPMPSILPTQPVEPPLQRPGTVAPTTPDLSAQLQRLDEMHSNGLLTDDEFRLAKARLIG